LARPPGDAVDAIPGERPVADARLVAELELEQRLPTVAVAFAGRLFEDEEVAVAALDDAARRQDVEVGGDGDRTGRGDAQRGGELLRAEERDERGEVD